MASTLSDRRSPAAEQSSPGAPERWPLVSAVVPTRDRPKLLRRAVEAILGQHYPGEVECIVVFDQSEPIEIDVELSEGRSLRLVRNQRTPGLAGARNAGAVVARGDLVAFCDDDDEWLPDKLRLQVEALRANPAAVAVSSGIWVHYGTRQVERVPSQAELTFEQLLRDRVMEVNPCSILVDRTALLERIGLVDEAIPASYGEDYEWLLRATRLAPIPIVPRPLVHIHWHASSFFKGRWQMIVAALTYLLDKYPEFAQEPRGLARIQGQIAFAHAAAGERAQARRMALRTLRHNWRERRAYVALAVSLGLMRPATVLRVAHLMGKGV